jgi:uncharacterized protein (TIGR02145 family)
MLEITIGEQIWSHQNLNVDKFLNGENILECKTDKEWKMAGKKSIPAYCSYNFNNENDLIYGKLYNWFAVNDSRSLALNGWSIPSEEDWGNLIVFLGEKPSLKLKAKSGWEKGEDGFLNIGTDNYGFNALPSGFCNIDGTFENFGTLGIWWSKTTILKSNGQELGRYGSAYFTAIASANGNVEALVGSMNSKGYGDKREGYSVRCIKKSSN